jgi:hypothetical protein
MASRLAAKAKAGVGVALWLLATGAALAHDPIWHDPRPVCIPCGCPSYGFTPTVWRQWAPACADGTSVIIVPTAPTNGPPAASPEKTPPEKSPAKVPASSGLNTSSFRIVERPTAPATLVAPAPLPLHVRPESPYHGQPLDPLRVRD